MVLILPGPQRPLEIWIFRIKVIWAASWQNQQNDCAPSEDSDQPGHPPSLIRCPVWSESSLCAQWVAKDPSFLSVDSEDSDQTGRMHRLIWVFAGRTDHLVGFVMRRLIYEKNGTKIFICWNNCSLYSLYTLHDIIKWNSWSIPIVLFYFRMIQ